MQRLKELYDRYKGAVFGYLYRMTGSAQEAEVLTQETYLQALLSLHRFRGDSTVLTWLLRIARNQYLKQLRKRGREIPSATVPELVADMVAGPEQNLIALDDQERIRTALA